jgi:metal-sulfur cluster biosynthetic enzyme
VTQPVRRGRALEALGAVFDPELDEPITTLGFVGSCVVSEDGDVDVHLRLPTPQCAPNFAFLMVADTRAALVGLPGVREVTVVLDDHYTGDEINAAVSHGGGFDDAFPGESGEAPADLEALRELFQRKALLARQGRVAKGLLAAGRAPEDVIALRLGELPASTPELERCVVLRRALGLPAGPDSPALIAAGDGAPLTTKNLKMWLARARLVGLSLESNGGICRSLLRVRHGVFDPTEKELVA